MAGVLFLLMVSAIINVLLAKALILKNEEKAKYVGMYKAEAKRCEILENQKEKLRFENRRRNEVRLEDLLRYEDVHLPEEGKVLNFDRSL